ncbi:hypothetical protein C789_3690 [Microcystis aeruginosa FACHB-905 = DIANCHI905]|uniref:Uncharacterized protein n=1 Tax=Microcystis aeruginosa PCC 7806SL TaxID=1903187 RepID=A0AB33BSW7_MICA7|nr:hypothetical protein BH695_3256 [Microcystis aeruginosa PCC 7806SL]ELS46497.1 hypothetical protein C789_3690 [Microcystis aeruginosa FACHB-905 = DIANCHI905]
MISAALLSYLSFPYPKKKRSNWLIFFSLGIDGELVPFTEK